MTTENGRKNAVSVPSLPRPRKRLRDTEEYWNGPVQKSATGWAEFVVDLELAEEVEILVSPHKMRSATNEAAGKYVRKFGKQLTLPKNPLAVKMSK
jgi:hypothetical protein